VSYVIFVYHFWTEVLMIWLIVDNRLWFCEACKRPDVDSMWHARIPCTRNYSQQSKSLVHLCCLQWLLRTAMIDCLLFQVCYSYMYGTFVYIPPYYRTLQQVLKSNNLYLNKAVDPVAENRPLWRLMSMLDATHS